MSNQNRKRQELPSHAGIESSKSLMEGTFDSFERRLRREREAQLARQSSHEEGQKKRHRALMKAMTTIRRALSETERIDLGSRFSFSLDVSDWQGWPRVELILTDKEAPEHRSHAFVVTAGDTGTLGYIRISNVRDETIERAQMSDEQSLDRIPVILKKTIREFLDDVTLYVLDPLAPEELLDVQTRGIAIDEEWGGGPGTTLGKADVFQEDSWDTSSNRADAPEELESIPLEVRPSRDI